MIARAIEARLARLLERFPCLLLFGARQTGKSTLVSGTKLGAGRTYVTFDDPEALAAAKSDHEAFLDQAERLTIDEVQRRPELFLRVKRRVDLDRKPGRFLLTGSSAAELLSGGKASALAGRAAVAELGPLTLSEVEGRKPLDWPGLLSAPDAASALRRLPAPATSPATLKKRILRGGLPLAWLARDDEAWRDWMRAYRALYLDRDVLPVRRLGAPEDFLRFMTHLAYRSGGLLSLSDAARDAGVPLSSAENYLRLLEGSCQWFKVAPFHRNLGKRLVKSPKSYWFDSGVLAFLMGVSRWEEARSADRLGALFETWVADELRAAACLGSDGLELHHWRTRTGVEVDFVLSLGERLLPLEAKAASPIAPKMLRGLDAFLAEHGKNAPFGAVIYSGSEHRLLGPRIIAISAAAF